MNFGDYPVTRPLPRSHPVLHTCPMQIADLSDDDPLKFYLRELATVQPLTSDEANGLLKNKYGVVVTGQSTQKSV